MKQSLNLNLGQSLTMTPALQQAIRMLQLSTVDLKTEIQEALESNVMLEADDGQHETNAEETSTRDTDTSERTSEGSDREIPENLPLDVDWDDIYSGGAPPTTTPPDSDEEDYWHYQRANLTSAPDLVSHLAWQADMHSFTDRERAIAEMLIDAVNGDGLLEGWDELRLRLAREFDVSSHDIEAILSRIQMFDPPGVAGRTLCECLSIQLAQMPSDTPARDLAQRLLDTETLAALASNNHRRPARRLNVPIEAVNEAVALLRTLQPHPGEAFNPPEDDYVVPEVFVTYYEGDWQVSLNSEIAPKLKINSEYLSLVKRADNSSDQTTLKSHLQEARFFLNSLKSRNDTLLKVSRFIVDAQRGFLSYGEQAMKPLVLRDVAEQLEIHESTVSRATAHKYIQTPRGVFELKYFFSSHVPTADGGTVSATAIQAMIKSTIAREEPGKPMSDNKLAELLKSEHDIGVARRTVAKYREAMSIAPSHKRKQKRN